MKPKHNQTDYVRVRYRERCHPVEKLKKAVVGTAIALVCMCGVSSAQTTKNGKNTEVVSSVTPAAFSNAFLLNDEMLIDLSTYAVPHDDRVTTATKSRNEEILVTESNKEVFNEEPVEVGVEENGEEENDEINCNEESELDESNGEADTSEMLDDVSVDEKSQENPVEESEEAVEEPTEEPVEEVPQITYRYMYSGEEYNILCRVTEAEVTGGPSGFAGNLTEQQVLEAKIHVAQVILNRVDSPQFPNTIEGVVFQKYAFSSVTVDGRYYNVTPTDLTRQAVEYALNAANSDTTYGALYFTAGSTYNAYADYIFTDAVNHSFFK